MNISRRMIFGFSVLMLLASVIGIVGVTIIMSLSDNLDKMSNTYAVVGEDINSFKFDVDFMVHMMHHYYEGHPEDESQFDEKYTRASDTIDEISDLMPKYTAEIDAVNILFEDIYDECKGTNEGVFYHITQVWAISEQIHVDFPLKIAELDNIINFDNTNQLDACRAQFYLDYQIHMVHHYIEGTKNGTLSAFTDAGDKCSTYLTNLASQSSNITTAAVAANLSIWFASFEVSVENPTLGLFYHQDEADEHYATVHTDFKTLRDSMNVLHDLIEADVESFKVQSSSLASISLIAIIAVIVVVIVIGLIIAVPTVKGIVKITNNMESVLKTGTEVSVNVSNMATELAASSSEVNAASEEIASTTQEVSMNTQNQVTSLVEISKMSNNINVLAHDMMKSTKDINRVMELITSISDQTNLLALNASIEAGRAGEHGRGFAVVADEVRKLAEESKNAVDETATEVDAITTRIATTVELIGAITEDIESTTTAGEENSRALEGISASSEQQTASMEEITSTANKLGSLAEDLKSELVKSEDTGKKKTNGKQKTGLRKSLTVIKKSKRQNKPEEA